MSEKEMELYFSYLKEYKKHSITELQLIMSALESLITEKQEIKAYEQQYPQGLFL